LWIEETHFNRQTICKLVNETGYSTATDLGRSTGARRPVVGPQDNASALRVVQAAKTPADLQD